MKKALLIIGSIGILYLFVSIILPNLIGVPLAAYHSYQAWNENGMPVSEFINDTDSVSKFPQQIGVVNDYGEIFLESQQVELSKILSDYDLETTKQIVVITIDSINPYSDIQKYASDIGEYWGVGNSEKDNGLVIVICKPCKGIGIATGIGTEKILTDKICEEVIDKKIIPEFKEGNFYDGIKIGLAELIEKWQ